MVWNKTGCLFVKRDKVLSEYYVFMLLFLLSLVTSYGNNYFVVDILTHILDY